MLRFSRLTTLLLTGTLLLIFGCRNKTKEQNDFKALSTLRVPAGFEVRLVVSEPLVKDPVDMEIDELGNMYVVEMPGNPFDKSGTGKVKLLKDNDNDGRMDTSFLFADSLRMPAGIMRWKNGILVTDAPNIFYFEDTDGDNIADIKKTIMTGFDSTDIESNVNNPYYGLDNWIYVCNGSQPETSIRFTSPANKTVLNNAGEHRVRFRPDSLALEMVSGKSQFGHTEDVAGHSFLVNNSEHIYEEVMALKYFTRNPDLVVSSATQLIPDHSTEVFPETINPENQLLTDVGVFTSACGINAYLGGAFGPQYDNAIFVCEPAHNLIHCDGLSADGATHIASRMEPGKEFLTSTDPWFRPVALYTGPDGALYVVDYYRQYIEGPAFMAEEVLKTANLYAGSDKGRIYKIVRKETNGNVNFQVNDSVLLQKLSDKNVWWRKTAQRLIVDRKLAALAPHLHNIAKNGRVAEGRLHALWTLEGIQQLTPDVILTSLHDTVAFVRENAIKIAEEHYLNDPQIVQQLLSMADDKDGRVRFQLTCTLGSLRTIASEAVVEEILFKYLDDPWMQVASLASLGKSREKILQKAIARYEKNNPSYSMLVERLSSMIASSGTPQQIYQLISKSGRKENSNNEWQVAVLKGAASGLEGRRNVFDKLTKHRSVLVNNILHHPSSEIRDVSMQIMNTIGSDKFSATEKVKTEAARIAGDSANSPSHRAVAIRLLGLTAPSQYRSLFEKSLSFSEPVIVQLAALNSLSAVPGTSPSQFIVQQWKKLTPAVRDEAVNTFMFDRKRISILLAGIENGTIAASVIGWPRSVTLMAGRWPKPGDLTTIEDSVLIKKARALLARDDKPKKELIKQYVENIKREVNEKNGQRIFSENCGVCHQVNGKQGVKLGPDLGTVRNWDVPELVSKILDPQQSVKASFEVWDITLESGAYIQGLITSETPNAITVANVNSASKTLARRDIKSITSSKMTIMPAGFEKQINVAQMSELIAYLKNQ